MANELQTKLDAILEDKNTNLLPNHLKVGVTCLGVEGNLEAGGTSTGAKLFKTLEEMNADKSIKANDYAVIYGTENISAKVDSEFQIAKFPNTVILPSAIGEDEYINLMYKSLDDTISFDFMGTLEHSALNIQCYNDVGEVSIYYESSDGITYTRGDGGDETVDFGTKIVYMYPEEWNDAIGYFIKIDQPKYEGLYMSEPYIVPTIKYNFRIEDNTLKYDIKEYDWKQDLYDTSYVRTGLVVVQYKDGVPYRAFNNGYGSRSVIIYNGKIYHGYISSSFYTHMFYNEYSGTRWGSNTYVTESECTTITTDRGNVYLWTTSAINDDENAVYGWTNTGNSSVYYIDDNMTVYDVPLNEYQGNTYYQWVVAPTQFTATNDDVDSKLYYGKNAAGEGTLQNTICDNAESIGHRVELYNKYKHNLVCNFTDATEMFYKLDIIELPVIDTSKVTRMFRFVSGCNSLVTVPLLNTSSVITFQEAFNNCTSLSDESLNNIMYMAINSSVTYADGKNLEYIGLTEEQATKCTTLSNYEAFTAAGWTTGY